MKQLARYQNIIIGLGVILLSFLLIRSTYSHYSLELKKLVKETEKIEETKKIIVQWTQLNGKYSQIKDKFLKEDTLLIKKFIEEKARAANIRLPSLRLSRSDKDSFWEVKVRIETDCNYNDFIRFVNSLAERNIEVVSASLNGSGSQVSIDADLKGVVLK